MIFTGTNRTTVWEERLFLLHSKNLKSKVKKLRKTLINDKASLEKNTHTNIAKININTNRKKIQRVD